MKETSALSLLSKTDLLNQTRLLAQEERRVALQLISHLEEIDRRLLYAELGYSSLFAFCTGHLGLSEGSAYRRIKAMQLARAEPDVKQKIKSGELSLTNAAKIGAAIQVSRKKNPSQTLVVKAVIDQCQNLSQRECEERLFSADPGDQRIKSLYGTETRIE